LDTDEVIVPPCFGIASLWSDLGPKSLSLHHGCLPDGLLSFSTTGHCKYRVCMAFFLRNPGVICVAMEIPETHPRSSVEAAGLFSNIADFRGRRQLEFLIRLRIG